MKSQHKTMAVAVGGGLLAGVVDAIFDHTFFYEGTFLDALICGLTPME